MTAQLEPRKVEMFFQSDREAQLDHVSQPPSKDNGLARRRWPCQRVDECDNGLAPCEIRFHAGTLIQ